MIFSRILYVSGIITVFLILILTSCSEYKYLSSNELHNFLNRNKGNNTVVIVDIRKRKEYSDGHLDGA